MPDAPSPSSESSAPSPGSDASKPPRRNEATNRPALHRDGQINSNAPASPEQRRDGALPVSDMSEELFDALDDIAEVVLALRDDPGHAEKAERLDQAGKQIVDTLVREFSLKSAQVEVLLRETTHVDEAWGTYVQKIARRNDHLDEGSAVA